MPSQRFIRTRLRFLQIRSDLLAICDGHHCEAALLKEMEFLSFRDHENDKDPSFSASLADLEDRLMGLYKRDRITKALDRLQELGFIEHDRSPGETPVFYLFVPVINEALARLLTKDGYPSENQSVPIGKTSTSHGKTDGSYKEEVEVVEEERKSPPIVPPAGGPQDIVHFLERQAQEHGVKLKLSPSQKERLREDDSEKVRSAALRIMAEHRGQRVDVGTMIVPKSRYGPMRLRGPSGATTAKSDRSTGPQPSYRNRRPSVDDYLREMKEENQRESDGAAKILIERGELTPKEWGDLPLLEGIKYPPGWLEEHKKLQEEK